LHIFLQKKTEGKEERKRGKRKGKGGRRGHRGRKRRATFNTKCAAIASNTY